MSKVSWNLIVPSRMHGLVAALHTTFYGGAVEADPFDTMRVREAVNLMVRLGTQLKLAAMYGMSPVRRPAGQMVLCAFEIQEDRDAIGNMVLARDCESEDGWVSCRSFSLTDANHAILLKVAGEGDRSGAGRRKRERDEQKQNPSRLRW